MAIGNSIYGPTIEGTLPRGSGTHQSRAVKFTTADPCL